MGEIVFGVPSKEVNWLQKRSGRKVFIEGGTFKGASAVSMARKFDLVITIEKDTKLHEAARERYPRENIRYLLGDTRVRLPEILPEHPAH